MNNKEINATICNLAMLSANLELTLLENEGEITDDVVSIQNTIEDLTALLSTDGVDSLGHWMKSVQDEIESLKAEKDFVSRKIESKNKCLDFIKEQMNLVMATTGQEKIKGSLGYSFTAITSEKTEVDKTELKERWADTIEKAIREKGVPNYVGVSLTASVSKAKEAGELDEKLFLTTYRPSVTFRKPRAAKED